MTQVEQLLKHVPPRMAMMGATKDGVPVVLDLVKPSTGSVLVSGSPDAGLEKLLQTVLYTATLRATPEELRVFVLSEKPELWSDFLLLPHLLGVYSPAHKAAQLEIDALVEHVHRLANDTPSDDFASSVLVLADDLPVLRALPNDLRLSIEYLIKQGPQGGTFIAAASNVDSLAGLGRWITLFKTRVIGHTESTPDTYVLAGMDDLDPNKLVPGKEFACRLRNGGWRVFDLPDVFEAHK